MDWLITRGEANTREEAIKLGKDFLEAGVFRHGMLKDRDVKLKDRPNVSQIVILYQ